MSLTMEPNPDIWALRSETNRILKPHRGHFLTLSTMFLPLSSFYVIYPILFFQLLNHFYSQQPQPINPNPLSCFLFLLYSLFVMFFSFCAVSTITYSVFRSFHSQPFNLLSSIKPIFTSFFPLLATNIVLKLVFFFISLFFALLFFLLILGTQLLGITSPPYFLGFCGAVLVVLPMLFVVIYLQVTWTLVPVIVVLESCWGLEALRRSASLIKGMKKVALTLLLFFWLMEGMFVWAVPVLNILIMDSPYGIGRRTFGWVNILLEIVGKSPLLMLYMFLNAAANTVLYILCKDIHADKCGKEYVSLSLDDKV